MATAVVVVVVVVEVVVDAIVVTVVAVAVVKSLVVGLWSHNKQRCNGHYNRTPDLGKCVMW